MRILITGADGQLGTELLRVLHSHDLTPVFWPKFDLLKPECETEIRAAKPDLVIHAAAYTDVDGAERDPDQAMAVNAAGTERVARAAAAVGARLMVISTDYVFDGAKGTPYLETDEPCPLNMYGLSKLEGERRAVAACSNTLIVRTAWLYGPTGKNFVKTIARLAGEQPELRVVADQRGCPTHAGDLAEAIGRMLSLDLKGIVHATGSGDCTWYDLAVATVQLMGKGTPVRPIATEDAKRPARRPPYSVLANRRLAEHGIVLPHWADALGRFMKSEQNLVRGASCEVR